MKKQWILGTLGITALAVVLIIIGVRGAWADVPTALAAKPSHARQTGSLKTYSPTIWQVHTAVAGGSGLFADSGQSLGSASSMGVALGDVDGDGDLDTFVANWGHASKVWLNDGTGTFSDSGQSLGGAGSYGYAVALGDVDGDGDPDAFVAHGANQGNKVWLNDGTGTFSDSGQSLGSAQSISVALGDVDGDGDLDAFVVDYGQTDTSKVWLNDGSGTFGDSGQSLGSSSGHAVALGDVDGDGDLDAFLVEYGQDDKVCLNDGTGTFSCQSLVGVSWASMDVALGHVDGDGDLDAFVAGYGQGNKVWLNDETGTFSDSGQSLGSSYSRAVALGDVDGDGDLDAFVANSHDAYGQGNKVWLNDGTGTFSDSGQSLGDSYSRAVALGDVDGDDDLDAFIGNDYGQANKVWLNGRGSIGLVIDGPTVDDMGFNWLSYQGLLRAESELGVTGTVYTSTTSADYGPNLQQCVNDGNDLCISVGFSMADAISNTAAANTETYFAIVDFAWESYPDNLRGMVFAADEASYVAGTLAGLMTQSNVVGDIGGMQIPPVEDFVEGYRNGAQCANPDVTVLITYTGTFGDPDLGAQVAQDMIAQGADVIFAAAGVTSHGAVLTATQSGVWGIGVDTDFYITVFMSGTVPGSNKLLSSVMKRVDNAVFDTIADVVSGTFTSGTVLYDLATDGVGLAPFHEADSFVPQSVRDELAGVEQGIINGTIDVNDPCVLTVTSTADSGPGTLRQALLDAVNGDTITFDPAVFPLGSPATITLTSGQLPDLNDGNVTIDAGNAGVILDGSAFSGGEDGFGVTSSGNVIKGMQIINFPGDGIEIYCGTTQDNVIGGSTPADRNVISGNGENGIRIDGAGVMSNTVSGNYIGVDASGTTALGNNLGVNIGGGARYNVIGGTTEGERNIISGNNENGLVIAGTGTMSNTVSGNYIGTDASGTAVISNGWNGVLIWASYNLVGGDTPGERNIISGNQRWGFEITGVGTSHNRVVGNYIGTDTTGTADLGNGGVGVVILWGASENSIENNVVSGNGSGISIHRPGTVSNTVTGNFIGTNASGSLALGNDGDGVSIFLSAQGNTVGGDGAGERNLISGNGENGVSISGNGTMSNTVSGNYIGTDASGLTVLGNNRGVNICEGARYNVIGGTTEGERNVISGNNENGLVIEDIGTISNTVIGNYIGTDASGTQPLGNGLRSSSAKEDALPESATRLESRLPQPAPSTPRENYAPDREPSFHAPERWLEMQPESMPTLGPVSDRASVPNPLARSETDQSQGEAESRAEASIEAGLASSGNAGDGVYIGNGASLNTVGVNNTIAFNGGHGVRVEGSDTLNNTVTRNSIFRNDGAGIALNDGGNGGLAAPRLTEVNLASGVVIGTACAGCTVEVFSADDEEGRTFEGETTADGAGDFVFNKGAALAGPNVTATATDADGNTSEFGGVAPRPLRIFVYDDYEEAHYDGSLREYLEARGHYVTYSHDNVGDIDVWADYADYDVILAIHTCGSGTLTNLQTWFQSGRGYVAMLGGGMWNDSPEDDYIMNLLGVGQDGNVGEGWSPDQLTWTDPAHPIAHTPHSGWDITGIPAGQFQYYIDITGGHTVVSGPEGAVVQSREGVEDAAHLVVIGTNYHDEDRSDLEARYLVENALTWASGFRSAVWVIPSYQSQAGAAGTTVSHQVRVVNRVSYDDSFALAVADNVWPTTIWDEAGTTEITDTGLIPDNGFVIVTVKVEIPAGVGTGESDRARIIATSVSDPAISDEAEVETFGPDVPAQVEVAAMPPGVMPGGDTTTIEARVTDKEGIPVVDGTVVTFTVGSGQGTVYPTTGTTVGGVVTATFTSGPDCGLARVDADAGTASGFTTVSVGDAGPTDVPGGSIISDAIWTACASPYLIHGDVIVEPGVTLTVEPGVQVRFDGDTGLYVLGTLSALGQPDNQIAFTANEDWPWPGYWKGLTLGDGDHAAGGGLEQAIVDYAGQWQNWNGDDYAAGVLIYRGAPHIRHSLIRRNLGDGLWAARDSLPLITDNDILDNGGGIAMQSAYLVASDTPIPSGEEADVWWRYLAFSAPGADWQSDLGFDDSTWSTGLTPIGDGWNYKTYLDLEGDTMYARKVITPASPMAATYYLRASRDDMVTVWVNGVAVFTDTHGGGAQWTPYIPVTLTPGANLIAVELQDSGMGANYFDLELAGGSLQRATISGNTIRGNGTNGWSGIYINHSSPLVQDNEIAWNHWNGIWMKGYSAPVIENNRVHHNGESGIFFRDEVLPTIVNNTIDRNAGAGIRWEWDWSSAPEIVNNIITNNGEEGIACQNSRMVIRYNDVWNNQGDYSGCDVGEGNISQDPWFVDGAGGDYHLQCGSPAIDAGDPDPAYNDVDDTRNDMGAYGGPGGSSYTYEDLRPPEVSYVGFMPGSYVPAGETITITADVWDECSAVAWVQAEIESDDGTVTATIELYDDGAHDDGDVGDGLFGNGWTTPAGERDYWVSVSTRDSLGHQGSYEHVARFTTRPFEPYFADFEASDGDFLAYDGQNVWQWGVPTSGPGSAYSGDRVWGTILDGDYPDNANEFLETPPISLGGISQALLSFWHWYDIEGDWDGGVVEVSTDDGQTFSRVDPLGGYPGTAWIFGGDPAYTGQSGGWRQAFFDLTPFVGNLAILRFHFASDTYVTAPGWYLDDVAVQEPLAHDVGVLSINRPYEVDDFNLTPIEPAATVVNLGAGSENFDVEMAIAFGETTGYSATVPVGGLGALSATQVHFPPWTPDQPGQYTVTVRTLLADDNPFNDELTQQTELMVWTFSDVTGMAGVGDAGAGWGVAWGDYDGDGDQDLYVSNAWGDASVLYRNNGDGTFSDVADEAGLRSTSNGLSVAWGDYDNDGWLDLYLANFDQPNALFHNNGDGTFSDLAGSVGVDHGGRGIAVAWADYDNDGWLDLYLANHGESNALYRNNGDGTFSDVTGQAGVGDTGWAYGAAWADYDNDGWLDLYVANFDQPNALFHNNGDGTFSELAGGTGVDHAGCGVATAWGDYDNDGWLDLYLANYGESNVLYRNNGDGTFSDLAGGAGVDHGGRGRAVAWGDYDNDGWLDLYLANSGESNVLYRNNGDGTFSDATGEANVGDGSSTLGAAWGDYDGDGDLDLYAVNNDEPNVLYRNNGNANGWLHVRTVGTVSNRDGIGARVTAGSQWQMREVSGGTGRSQDSLPVEFGFGTYTGTVTVEVAWPSGVVDTLTGVAVDQVITVTESGGAIIISDVKVTNVRDTSFTVSWITNVEVDGEVHYGTDPANLNQTAYDDRGTETSDDTHYVTLQELSPNTTYYFDVVSDGTTDDNGGAHYSVATGPTLGLPASDTIDGQVFQEDGTTPAEGTIVYITLRDEDGDGSSGEAAPMSALVDEYGWWYANLGNARTADLSGYFDYSASGDWVLLKSQGAADGVGCLAVYTAEDTPAAPIVLNVSRCTWPIDIQVGWNHISLPLVPLTPYTAEDVCDEINSQGGDVAEIDRWYASGWDGHICGLPFNDFDVELGSDYFIRSNAVSTWIIEGYEVTTEVLLDLQVAWNSIGIPLFCPSPLTPEDLCQQLPITEVDRWYAAGWDGHICGLPFNDFNIEPGKGYFVLATAAGTFPVTCNGFHPFALTPTKESHPVPEGGAVAIGGVRITNLRDTSFAVSWTMHREATGYVELAADGRVFYDVRGEGFAGDTHYVMVTGLAPKTTYIFDIQSGATVDNKAGMHYTIATLPTLDTLPDSDAVYGQVFLSNGVTPAEGAIVYLTLADADGQSSPGEAVVMSALVDEHGWWQANLGNARLVDGSGSFAYSTAGDAVTLVAQGAGVGLVTRTVDTGDLRPATPLVPAWQFRLYLPLIARE